MGFRLEYCIMTNLDIDLDQIKKWWQCPTMLSTKWVCRTECSFCILLVPMVYCIMTDLVLSTKWVNRIECSFADRPDSTNGDSVLPYCQQNGSAVQNVVSVIDPLQQIMTLKIGETTNYTAGSSIHINKFVDQQYGSTTQIVVSAPTSTNGVIPNRQNWYGELYGFPHDILSNIHRSKRPTPPNTHYLPPFGFGWGHRRHRGHKGDREHRADWA